MKSFSRIVAAVVYLVMLVVVSWAMWQARGWALETYGDELAREQWQEWVQEARKQSSSEGPVQRRAPKRDEPPAVILMRDHFAVCLVGALLLCSMVYATLAFFALGVLHQDRAAPSLPAPDKPS